MYERMNRSDDNALAYRILQPLSSQEMEAITTELEGTIAARGSIRVLIELRSFPYAELASLWEDLKFDVRYVRKLERFALVGNDEMEKWAVLIFGALTFTRCRCFPADQLDEAWTWLIEGDR